MAWHKVFYWGKRRASLGLLKIQACKQRKGNFIFLLWHSRQSEFLSSLRIPWLHIYGSNKFVSLLFLLLLNKTRQFQLSPSLTVSNHNDLPHCSSNIQGKSPAIGTSWIPSAWNVHLPNTQYMAHSITLSGLDSTVIFSVKFFMAIYLETHTYTPISYSPSVFFHLSPYHGH